MVSSEINPRYSPMVSAIVPLFNGSSYIEACLKSILAQTYDRYEIIVINDGSTDDGIKKVEDISRQYPDRIRILFHSDRKNHGIAASRNLGVVSARGEYVAFLDQDDIWIDKKLATQIEMLRKYPDASFIYAKTSFIDDRGCALSIDNMFRTAGKGSAGGPKNVFKNILKENFVPTLTVLAQKKCLMENGLFDEGPRHEYEDWLLWTKIAFTQKFVFVPEVLSKYRYHGENYSFFRLESGLDNKAEEHYIISLFTFIMKKRNADGRELRNIFRGSVFRFFLRARSWGMREKELEEHKNSFVKQFPDNYGTIQSAFRMARALNPGLLCAVRRIRRMIVRV